MRKVIQALFRFELESCHTCMTYNGLFYSWNILIARIINGMLYVDDRPYCKCTIGQHRREVIVHAKKIGMKVIRVYRDLK